MVTTRRETTNFKAHCPTGMCVKLTRNLIRPCQVTVATVVFAAALTIHFVTTSFVMAEPPVAASCPDAWIPDAISHGPCSIISMPTVLAPTSPRHHHRVLAMMT